MHYEPRQKKSRKILSRGILFFKCSLLLKCLSIIVDFLNNHLFVDFLIFFWVKHTHSQSRPLFTSAIYSSHTRHSRYPSNDFQEILLFFHCCSYTNMHSRWWYSWAEYLSLTRKSTWYSSQLNSCLRTF